jgi:hypothetical protein
VRLNVLLCLFVIVACCLTPMDPGPVLYLPATPAALAKPTTMPTTLPAALP